jgi:hypothetical protein
MYVSLNKQLKIFEIASKFSLGFTRERVKRCFLIPNVSAGNTKLFACELRRELSRSKRCIFSALILNSEKTRSPEPSFFLGLKSSESYIVPS